MDDLISRQAAIELIESEYHRYSEEYGITDVLCDLNDLPTAEKKGKWGHYGDPEWLRNDGKPVFILCSECNNFVLNNASSNWNYCPNCGARMEESE